jgi:Ran GTPase-activating protein (RanGAP) involved in mRNA processing and transport
VRAIDLSSTNLQDEQIDDLCNYLDSKPPLYSITLNNNPFTDSAMTRLTDTLKKNDVVCHLSMQDCFMVTNAGLLMLLDVVNYYNMVLF